MRAIIGNGEIELVVGGQPCLGVSLIGHRALDDPRNSLMQHFVRLVIQLNPRFFIMENVKGLTVGPHRAILSEVINAFERSGFVVERRY